MTRPRLLDLFAGAGGCSVGYNRAGFDVVGVDIEDHPNHPYELIVADALEVLGDRAFLAGFDVIHASPPCQAYSTATPEPHRHPRLIAPVRLALRAVGVPYVIENVTGARPYMISPSQLCGSSFGLPIRRHRLFESSALIMTPSCAHTDPNVVGIYGDHPEPRPFRRPDGSRRGDKATSLEHARRAMGIDWMTWDDLKEAIPPVYCELIGAQLLDQLAAVA